MSLKLILKPCNEHFLPISSPTTISVDSIKSQLRSPQKKAKPIIDLNSEFTLDYFQPICLSSNSTSIRDSSTSSPLLNSHKHIPSYQIGKITKIIDIKYFISSQINIKPEALSLFMFNPSTVNKFQLLNDYEEFVTYNPTDQKSTNHRKRKYSSSTSDESKQRVLYFKISKEKERIIIDIFQNKIEKLILDVSSNCSIYMLKHLINIKLGSNIPLEQFTLYGVGFVDNHTHLRQNQAMNKALTNKVLNDEVLIEEIAKYYLIINPNQTSRERRCSDNTMLNMILTKKTKNKCVMGLDFRFNYMKNFIKLSFDKTAPSYRETSDGLNLFFYCNNPSCNINQDYYIVVKGYGHFDIMEEITSIKCPQCYSVKKDLRNIGFIKSKWKYNGLLKNKKDSRIEGDGLTLDNKLYVFHEVLFAAQFQLLIIQTEAYIANSDIHCYSNSNSNSHRNDGNDNSSNNENDSSSDLNDISLCYPKEGEGVDDDKGKVKDCFQLEVKKRNNNTNLTSNSSNIIIKNEFKSINIEPDDIIMEGKIKKNSYGCSIFSNPSEGNEGNNYKSCSCLIV